MWSSRRWRRHIAAISILCAESLYARRRCGATGSRLSPGWRWAIVILNMGTAPKPSRRRADRGCCSTAAVARPVASAVAAGAAAGPVAPAGFAGAVVAGCCSRRLKRPWRFPSFFLRNDLSLHYTPPREREAKDFLTLCISLFFRQEGFKFIRASLFKEIKSHLPDGDVQISQSAIMHPPYKILMKPP